MFKKRSPQFRPSILDYLEDRAVPTSGIATAHVSAAAAKLSTLQAELTQVGAQNNAAYATFTTAVNNTEASLIAATPTTASVLAQIDSLVNTLAASVSAAVSTVPSAAADASVIARGINGTAPGTLLSRMTNLLNAASTSGTVSQANLPLLFTAVEGTISSSYTATAVQGYLAGIGSSGHGSGLRSSTGTAFNLTTFGAQSNSAYATFALTVETAELTLPTATSMSIATGTTASVASTIDTAINTLGSTLSASLVGTTASPYASSIQNQIAGGTLSNQMTALLAAAAPTGTISAANLPLLYTAVNSAINASYASIAVEGFLVGSATTTTSTASTTKIKTGGTETTGSGATSVGANVPSAIGVTQTATAGSTGLLGVGTSTSDSGSSGGTSTGTSTTSVGAGSAGSTTSTSGTTVGTSGTTGTTGTTTTGTSGSGASSTTGSTVSGALPGDSGSLGSGSSGLFPTGF